MLRALAALRARGLRAETDYLGRSQRGQLTQASRLRARTIVFAGASGATVRRRGEKDSELPYEELVERLA